MHEDMCQHLDILKDIHGHVSVPQQRSKVTSCRTCIWM